MTLDRKAVVGIEAGGVVDVIMVSGAGLDGRSSVAVSDPLARRALSPGWWLGVWWDLDVDDDAWSLGVDAFGVETEGEFE